MPAEFQKAMDYTLIGLENTYCFLNDILIVSKGSLNDNKNYVMKCLQRLDDENLRINLPKCHFGKLEIDWLGYHISQEGNSPLESKIAAILALEAPKTLKKLQSFLGSVHYIGKFIPNLAQISHPLRPLLRKSSKFIWTTEHENCFQEIKTRIANATANSHYNAQLETRVKCDASRSGLGAALEQLTVDGWKPIAFASRFLNSCQERYSVNELELLGVVWSTEYFKNYLYGKQFKVITNHRALLSIMKEHRSNKSYNSRLTRWVDRLLPFQFDIEHLPGSKMGLVEYISRNPSQKAKKISTYDEEFIVAKLKLISKSVNSLELNTEHPASHLHQLLTNYTLDPQNTSKIEILDPALQTTPKIGTTNNSINSISTRATRVREHVFGNSLAPRNHASNSICQLNNLKYVTLASQSPLCISLALQNTSNNKQLIQIRNKVTYAQREHQITQLQVPPIKSHSTNNSKSHHPELKSVLFASCHSRNQLHPSSLKNSNQSSSVFKYINSINSRMPSKKRITRVRFNDASHAADQLSTSDNTTRPASTRSNLPTSSRAANQSTQNLSTPHATSTALNTTPTSPTHSSNSSTPLTPSPHVPTFKYIVSKIFNKSLIASLTSKDAVLKEVRDCILTNNESRLKAINPYIHSYWRDLHVRSGCVCVDERVAIPNVLREVLIDDIHSSHPGTWGMICMATHSWWPYMHRELIVKCTECKPCTVIGKNLKSVIPAKQFTPHIPCVEPNQEIQIDLGGPIFDGKGNEVYFLAAIDRFSKYPTAYFYDKANGPNFLKFLDMYIETHGIPRSIRLDQAKCLIGHQVKTFCNKNKIEIIEAPVNDHRAIGLVERLIQTIKNRLACIKEEKLSTHAFHVKHALKIIIHQLRICKQRTTKTSPFEAHFGRKPNTPLSVIATKPNLLNLSYKSIINHYLDEDTVMPEDNLPDDKWINGYRSDIEVELGMTRATTEAGQGAGQYRWGTKIPQDQGDPPQPHGKRRSKKNLEGLYEVLAPGSHILKVSPTTSTIKEPGKQEVTVRNSVIAKFGTQLERQTPLKVYADRRGPRSGEKVVEELIHSHIKELTRKQKGDKKMKHRKREPGSGVSSQRSNISRAMRGRIPKLPNFSAIRNQQPPLSTSEPTTTTFTHPATTSSTTRTSDRTRRRSPSYYGFETSPPASDILPPSKRPRRAGDVENFAHLTPLSNRYSKLWKINPRNKMCHPVSALSRLPLPEIHLCYIRTPQRWFGQ